MEQFKAEEEDWQRVEAEAIIHPIPSTICELRDRVEKLEAAGRAEQGSSSQGILDDSTPDPDPDAPQTLHTVALGMMDTLRHRIGVTGHICDTIERAIREPMAEQQAAAEPEPTHPQYFSSHHAIAEWLRSKGYPIAAELLEQEANR